jgi:hypothetical protein
MTFLVAIEAPVTRQISAEVGGLIDMIPSF